MADAGTNDRENIVNDRGEYLEQLQAMVDGVADPERRASAQSALDEVGKDLGFAVAKDTPVQEQGIERVPDFDRDV